MTDCDLIPTAAFWGQHFTLADMVGLAHHAFLFHALDDAGGAVVADLQVALDEAGGAFALARDQRDRLVVEVVARAAVAAAEAVGILAERAILVALGHFLQVGGLALALQELDDALDLAVGDEGAVDARDAAAVRHVEHVALAQQLLGTGLAQDGA